MNTPIVVPYDDFCHLFYCDGKADALKARKHIRTAIVVAAVAVFAAVIAFAFSIRDHVGPEYLRGNNMVFAAVFFCGVVHTALFNVWRNVTATFRIIISHFDFRIRRAETLLKHYACFGDTHKHWKGMHQSFADVMHWCSVNGIQASIAKYEDPMFGEFKIYVSFTVDEYDPESAEEALIFFKLKFL